MGGSKKKTNVTFRHHRALHAIEALRAAHSTVCPGSAPRGRRTRTGEEGTRRAVTAQAQGMPASGPLSRTS